MAAHPENPPNHAEATLAGKRIRRIDKPNPPAEGRREAKRPSQASAAPGWRQWLNTKML